MLVAGVDSSTQSTKVILCEAEDGTIVGRGSALHPAGTECPPQACCSADHQACGGHSVPAGCGALPRPTIVPSSASHRITLVDCVEESTPATSTCSSRCQGRSPPRE